MTSQTSMKENNFNENSDILGKTPSKIFDNPNADTKHCNDLTTGSSILLNKELLGNRNCTRDSINNKQIVQRAYK